MNRRRPFCTHRTDCPPALRACTASPARKAVRTNAAWTPANLLKSLILLQVPCRVIERACQVIAQNHRLCLVESSATQGCRPRVADRQERTGRSQCGNKCCRDTAASDTNAWQRPVLVMALTVSGVQAVTAMGQAWEEAVSLLQHLGSNRTLVRRDSTCGRSCCGTPLARAPWRKHCPCALPGNAGSRRLPHPPVSSSDRAPCRG